VVQIARAMGAGGNSLTPFGYVTWQPATIAPLGETNTATYLRVVVRDRPGILARVCGILAKHGVNIDSVFQEPGYPKDRLPFVMTLDPIQEKKVRRAVIEIARAPFLVEPPMMLPFAELP
jgi:homoserine dehydrogenase